MLSNFNSFHHTDVVSFSQNVKINCKGKENSNENNILRKIARSYGNENYRKLLTWMEMKIT